MPSAPPHPSATLTPVSLRLGHAAGLTAHRAVIQHRGRRFTTLKGKASKEMVHKFYTLTWLLSRSFEKYKNNSCNGGFLWYNDKWKVNNYTAFVCFSQNHFTYSVNTDK